VSVPTIAEFVLFLLVVTALVRPVGGYLTRVFSGHRTWLDPALVPLERAIYRLTGVDPWTRPHDRGSSAGSVKRWGEAGSGGQERWSNKG
jgi:K+-transporting ATPase A subunit